MYATGTLLLIILILALVGAGAGEQLHDGRVYTPPAGGCRDRRAGQNHSGATPDSRPSGFGVRRFIAALTPRTSVRARSLSQGAEVNFSHENTRMPRTPPRLHRNRSPDNRQLRIDTREAAC